VYLLVDPGFLFLLPLNFYEASRFVPPVDAPDGHNGLMDEEKNKQTDVSVCLFESWMEFDTKATSEVSSAIDSSDCTATLVSVTTSGRITEK